jgi:hypothetical protein
MVEKLGFDFTVIDSERCAADTAARPPVRGLPVEHRQPALARMPKAQRLLAEVLPAGGPSLPRTFDLLILDKHITWQQRHRSRSMRSTRSRPS